jgi:hypothetical protein
MYLRYDDVLDVPNRGRSTDHLPARLHPHLQQLKCQILGFYRPLISQSKNCFEGLALGGCLVQVFRIQWLIHKNPRTGDGGASANAFPSNPT